MTPHHLTAAAAAESLRDAQRVLARRATAEARQRGEALIAAGPISSPTYGSRHAVGGHADPVIATLTLSRASAHETTWLELLRRLDGKLSWLADTIHAGSGPTPVGRIRDTIPRLLPGTARIVARHLADEDAWVRALPGDWPTNRRPLPGVPCPHCGQRQLQVQCAGPVDVWTVVCATGQLCVGAGCGCGMAAAVEGAPHIWRRADVIGAAATATPTPTN
ncbi:hypothetical protein [Verrucosispora sp. WMMD1129]|uniref:hypothetical protein n=1 Tax=Verrucosispora sp. WMMD1129 TaxID=3016093 RepID=UPI00249CE318|nr:hypothetical protein [Verrucosispora sp. WMMD1129]WFE45320.1 hypothetical protein O7624_13645 [Verrucosispora sp. WMMD1129]